MTQKQLVCAMQCFVLCMCRVHYKCILYLLFEGRDGGRLTPIYWQTFNKLCSMFGRFVFLREHVCLCTRQPGENFSSIPNHLHSKHIQHRSYFECSQCFLEKRQRQRRRRAAAFTMGNHLKWMYVFCLFDANAFDSICLGVQCAQAHTHRQCFSHINEVYWIF